MNDGGKSDKLIVPEKDANKGSGQPDRRSVWREGAWPREIRESKPGFWTQRHVNLPHALNWIRTISVRYYPRQEPGAVVPHAGICAGGAG